MTTIRPGQIVEFLISECPDPVRGRVVDVLIDAIGKECAEIEVTVYGLVQAVAGKRCKPEIRRQYTEFLTVVDR